MTYTGHNIRRYPRVPRYKLIEARVEKGLTQTELADEIGITRFQVLAVEVGLRDPSLQTMLKWVKALDSEPLERDRLDLFDTEHAL